MDIFHGESHGLVKERHFSKATYFLGLACTIFWQVSIPYTRLVMGVHSPNQILFGNMCGNWCALFLHFVVRDRLILHVEKVLASQSESEDNASQLQPLSIQVDDEQPNELPTQPFSAKNQVIFASTFYVLYEIAAIFTFFHINGIVTPTSKDFLLWSNNYHAGGCGVLNMQFSLQNICLNGCGYLTGPFFIYIFTVYRSKVNPFGKDVKIHDSQQLDGPRSIAKHSFLRLILVAIANLIWSLPD